MLIPSEGRVLLLDKPVGPTSFDAVAAVRRGWRERRVGHSGTLDPLASGLLVICAGEATKLVPYLTDCDKTYEATIRLGIETLSGDLDGARVFEASDSALNAVTDPALAAAVGELTGELLQVPPVYSAIKVNGRPLHARARAGEDVVAPPRRVRVDTFEIQARDGRDLSVRIACAKGTYVRSLAIDLGRALGVGGHLTALRRTRVGPFDVSAATTLDAFREGPLAALAGALRPAAALRDLPSRMVEGPLAVQIRQGKTPLVEWPPAVYATLTDDGGLVAIVQVDQDGRLRVLRGFVERTT